jgi:biopolymer transport protein ExbB
MTLFRLIGLVAVLLSTPGLHAAAPGSWWNKEWTVRKKVTIDPAAAEISEPIAPTTILVRLHEGNFKFEAAKEDGSDIRAVAADDKTLLPSHLEKFDSLLNEAFVWVKVTDLKPGTPLSFWLYYGNANAAKAEDPKTSFDADTVLVYHFAEHGTPPGDATANANNAQNVGTATDGTIIATGLRLDGRGRVKLPESPSLNWKDGDALTISLWLKPAALAPNTIFLARRDGDSALRLGVDEGKPYAEVISAAGTQRAADETPIDAGAWRHLAFIFASGKFTLLLDGETIAKVDATLPALKSAGQIGGDIAADEGTPAQGFVGELDELQIARVARSISALKFAAISEGTGEKAQKLVTIGADEESGHGGESEFAKHVSLLKDISKSLTPDGWAVIFLCSVLALLGGVVTVLKFTYLTRITKATKVFLKQWENLSADLSVLDHGDEESIRSMAGNASPKTQKVLRQSPLYHLYQIGFSEIQHRVQNAGDGFRGLSGRSMQAIKATLDGGLVREVQRLNSQLVFLTVGIAGGPYLGLLGTVIGVMITFAVIAKSGEVEVNSIAPGIAGALLATVAGLAVAIPALFAYSYISSRIKEAVSEMQIFIDEFVAKIAEAFPEVSDAEIRSSRRRPSRRDDSEESDEGDFALSETP